ncbi:hypothetical protein [Corynebacterium tuberculostearicum]|uniref:hypothetical protein n=1 Tax=Corynebacterium tuberculostearicum TaxID=38304 RepID=UPI00195E4C91|nr:hypothetical protein [Corynebacterium tuberculostearicum]QRQ67103.1 hypothetical protein I6J28_11240 [Corynebacterium tuberculostearicum]
MFVRGASASEGSAFAVGCGSEEDVTGAELVELELIVELSAVLEVLGAVVSSFCDSGEEQEAKESITVATAIM